MATFRASANTSPMAAAACRSYCRCRASYYSFRCSSRGKKDDGRSDVASSKWPRLMSGKYRQSHKTSAASAAAAPFTNGGVAASGAAMSERRSLVRPLARPSVQSDR